MGLQQIEERFQTRHNKLRGVNAIVTVAIEHAINHLEVNPILHEDQPFLEVWATTQIKDV